MPAPYSSNRAGSVQWIMQRASAALLVGLAGVHFGIQHFTSDAVSTGLTVSARLNDPFWQGYYALFIVLAVYHGVNGVIGILRDFAPRPAWRGTAEVLLWVLALGFGALAVKNVVSPVPLGVIKDRYAARGFPAGETMGNPPSAPKTYDFRDELRELHLLRHYLATRTDRTEATPLAEVFGEAKAEPTAADVAACGERFDRWVLAQAAAGPVSVDRRGHSTFSSTHEYAVWAAAVRRADAQERLRRSDTAADRAIVERLQAAPAYSATQLH